MFDAWQGLGFGLNLEKAPLAALLDSVHIEVQTAAALVLARLSRSQRVQREIVQSGAMESLKRLESGISAANLPVAQREAAQYAQWTLRVPGGTELKSAWQGSVAAEAKVKEAAEFDVLTKLVQAATPNQLEQALAVARKHGEMAADARGQGRRPTREHRSDASDPVATS